NLPRRVLKVPGVRVVAIRAAKQTTRNEQNDTQAGSIAARRGFIGMQVTICAVGLFLNCVLIRSIRREGNVQIVAAASKRSRYLFDLDQRCSKRLRRDSKRLPGATSKHG